MIVPTIELDRVSLRYGTARTGVHALREVTLRVTPGEFLAVTGPSGSGKSSLLNLIAGLDTPTSGRIIVAGHDLATLSDDARSALRLRHVGFVFQSFNLFPAFTVEHNVSCPLHFLGVRRREARDRAALALAQVGLPRASWDRRPAELSGGEQQRVAIARALVIEPRVLLADEPTGNLDSATGRAILDLVKALNTERALTVVMVTHSTEAAGYGSRWIELCDGAVVRDESAPRWQSGQVGQRSV